jgi:hypothetical protein
MKSTAFFLSRLALLCSLGNANAFVVQQQQQRLLESKSSSSSSSVRPLPSFEAALQRQEKRRGLATTTTTTVLEMAKQQQEDKDDDDDVDDDKNKVSFEEIEMDLETWQQEQEASRRVSKNLVGSGGPNFGSIVYAVGFAIIVGGFAMEQFGYDYVIKDGRVTIGTIEERQFQKEITKETKETTTKQQQQQQLLLQQAVPAQE